MNISTSQASIFKALGDENRIAILKLLANGEMCACKLQESLRIGQSTLSHHIHILRNAKIISARRDGKWIFYSLNPQGGFTALCELKSLLRLAD